MPLFYGFVGVLLLFWFLCVIVRFVCVCLKMFVSATFELISCKTVQETEFEWGKPLRWHLKKKKKKGLNWGTAQSILEESEEEIREGTTFCSELYWHRVLKVRMVGSSAEEVCSKIC